MLALFPLASCGSDHSVDRSRDVPERAGARPADILILIDGSSRMADSFDLMRLAATTVAATELDPDSRIAGNVFGSRRVGDGATLKPVDDLCPLAPVREVAGLLDCLDSRAHREPRLGDGSDLERALRHAQQVFGGDEPDRDRIVFVLTDGVIDLHGGGEAGPVGADGSSQDGSSQDGSSQDGSSADSGTAAATANDLSQRRLVDEVLPALRAAGVRVVAVPFGQTLYHPRLLGYGDPPPHCAGAGETAVPAAVPTAVPIGAADTVVVEVVARQLAAIRCIHGGHVLRSAQVQASGSAEFSVHLPPWATTAGLTVVGASEQTDAQVDFIRPDGSNPLTGHDADGGRAWLGGAGTDAETLHVVAPEAGDWTVRVTAPSSSGLGEVQVRSLWSGAPTMTFTIDPPRPFVPSGGAALNVNAAVRVVAPAHTFGDELAGLSVRVRATGTGVSSGPQARPSPLVGRVLDPGSGNEAEFVGPVAVPGTPSDVVTYTAELLLDDEVLVSQDVVTSVTFQERRGRATVPGVDTSAEPGDRVRLTFDLWPSGTDTVELRLTQPSAPGLAVSGSRVRQSDPDAAELVVGSDAEVGTTVTAVVEAHDARHPEDLLGLTRVEVEVTTPGNGLWWGYWLVLGLSGALAAGSVCALLYGRRVKRRLLAAQPARPIENLCLYLYRQNADAGEPEHYLTVPPGRTELPFAIERDETDLLWLKVTGPTERHLGVLSGGASPGKVKFRPEAAEYPTELALGKPIWNGEGGLYVTVVEEPRDRPGPSALAVVAAATHATAGTGSRS